MKRNRRFTSSERLEQLARDMRERAILIENDPEIDLKTLHRVKLRIERQRQIERVEQMKKIYFNAGRWAGGARDHNAREAFHKMNEMESK